MSEWMPVRGYEGRYEVSSDGKVRKAGSRALLGQWLNGQGYSLVRLSRPRALIRAHRLVAEAFLPNPENKPFVNHIDNNRANNAVSNLEWCTQAENLRHAARQGRNAKYWKGRRSPAALLSDDAVRAIRSAYVPRVISLSMLATRHGVSKRCIGRIINREIYADV